VGVMTAYFCSIHPLRPRVTLLEPGEIPAAASRNAGGLLAADWHGPATESLGLLSYRLHADLAKQYDGMTKWGYRPVDTVSVQFDTAAKRSKKVPGIDWLDNGIVERSNLLGTTKTTAQVHPRLFVQEMAAIARQNGVRIVKASLVDVERLADGGVTAVTASLPDGTAERILCTDLVLPCGRLTGSVARKVLDASAAERIDVGGYRAHSVRPLRFGVACLNSCRSFSSR
jgi:glycine/D-amino acid oxidase-like deaminating enzyme